MIILKFIHNLYLEYCGYRNLKRLEKIINNHDYEYHYQNHYQLWIRCKYDPDISLVISDNYYGSLIAIIDVKLAYTSNKDWLNIIINSFNSDKPSISKLPIYYKSPKDINIQKEEQIFVDILKAEYRKSLIKKILK